MSSTTYPKSVRNGVLSLMVAAIAAMFLASFTAFFPGTSQQSKQAATERGTTAPNTAEAESAAFGFSAQTTDTLGQLMGRLQREPDNVDLLLDISTLFLDNQGYDQAKNFLTRAVVTDPTNLDARMMLGRCLYLQDNVEGAARAFEDILALQPYAPAMINLGILYKHHLNRVAEAKAIFEKVLQTPGVDEELTAKARQELEK
ncbi:tetratricopeptide repeat protein [Desulfovibrio cuneatus]|uniref:tetratricopeptide repeat protein n=1 Tax=Desulfovibrio cuneatus TaxID=159728 RepID=UPI000411A648|nr:tetratricopeptide repeat protein [Desulfovibrio cuneatus]